MYSRWLQIKKEFNIKKEYIKSIEKSTWEDEIYYIKIVDELSNKIDITINKKAKKYRIDIESNNLILCTSLLDYIDEPVLYKNTNGVLELY